MMSEDNNKQKQTPNVFGLRLERYTLRQDI